MLNFFVIYQNSNNYISLSHSTYLNIIYYNLYTNIIYLFRLTLKREDLLKDAWHYIHSKTFLINI